jgi:hypothetical protein
MVVSVGRAAEQEASSYRSWSGRRLEKLSTPTPEHRRVFELLGKPIPLRLDGT